MTAPGPVWGELVGQEAAVRVLVEAAAGARALIDGPRGEGDGAPATDDRNGAASADSRSMSHAWLITGPPGSGRSVAARAFAAALQCTGPEPGCGRCPGCRTTMGRTNGDVRFVATEGSIITTQTARGLVHQAQSAPSQGRWLVIVVEDADRLNEQGANALLKAIEEPPERTVWVLCAPSPEDMIQTIRSRCRHLGLRIPRAQAVADLLVREGAADAATALESARAAQSHIGLARALARDPQMRRRRREIIAAPVRVRSVGEAVFAADRLLETAKEQAEAQTAERDARERAELMRQLGVEDGEAVARQSRGLLRSLEEDQKRRQKRALNDALDRALVDLLAIYRDVLMIQLSTGQELVNTDLADLVAELAGDSRPRQTMERIASIEDARRRLLANGNPLLVLEAMAISLRPQV
ncbi:DNA polymerase III subunit delta' [Actinomyces sp. B33]|uniref:DNA polymerase III subunit delta' n=1 Tax=Actinomyces sp. B33 TaxID=2942131 RepID=UPI00233FE6C7|nr:DNA polymerase III subunit delta' [Actinomyces sp. B33]MDC4232396.1 DNA polymerase III subunit delta' [Actinomyces sp. B33]